MSGLLDQPKGLDPRGLLVPKPAATSDSLVHTPVRQDRETLGRERRAPAIGLRHTLHEAHEADPDLSSDPQPTSYPAPTRAHQAREHRPLSGHRGRGRSGSIGRNGGLNRRGEPVAGCAAGSPSLSLYRTRVYRGHRRCRASSIWMTPQDLDRPTSTSHVRLESLRCSASPIQNNHSLLGISTGTMLLIVIATMAATAMGIR